jgi:hypothetical protein
MNTNLVDNQLLVSETPNWNSIYYMWLNQLTINHCIAISNNATELMQYN